MSRHFTEEDIQMANNQVKKQLTSLVTGIVYIKTTMSCHHILFRVAKMVAPSAGEGAEKRGCSYTHGGDVKCQSHSDRQFGSSTFHLT